ncbi:hypothetical protein M8C21_028519 [Ambrosia artemisiifolia]|uniref:Uncharacterized protein n=1 Tax=Ambrosia artemisiifolia TaxID=4212 RepID=A0AAD5GM58_AMBAR|nr:hypothetical protein M8C21_028519 [Ambrosia artemisiifolia]
METAGLRASYLVFPLLSFPFSYSILHRCRRLDRRIVVDMHMPMLFMRYGVS